MKKYLLIAVIVILGSAWFFIPKAESKNDDGYKKCITEAQNYLKEWTPFADKFPDKPELKQMILDQLERDYKTKAAKC